MSTSKLQIEVGSLLDKTFPQYRVRENHRPDWLISNNLTKMELDFYIEDICVAFEIQGAQHYQFVPFFHGTYENFEKMKSYDMQKKDLCVGAGVKLIEIHTMMDAIIAIKSLDEKHNPIVPQEPYFYAPPAKNKNQQRKEAARKITVNFGDDENKTLGAKKFIRFSLRRKYPKPFEFEYLTRDEQEILRQELRNNALR